MQEQVLDYGILVAAGLAVIGYYWKLNQHRKESAKTLLFYLMEIRQELLIERPKQDAVVKEFQTELSKILGDRPKLKSLMVDQMPKEYMARSMPSMMDGLVRADQNLLENYETALLEYSRINPLVAHRLRGMKLLPKLSANLSNIGSSVVDLLPEGKEGELMGILGKNELDSTRRHALEEFIGRLEKIIRRVSWSSGVGYWVKSWLLPWRRRRDQESEEGTMGADLEAFMDRFFRLVLVELTPSDEVRKQVENASLDSILDSLEKTLSAAEH